MSGSTTNGLDPTNELDPITEPVLNTPYEVTQRHWQLDQNNRARPIPEPGRRKSIAILPVPDEHDPDRAQQALVLSRENLNETVNDIRTQITEWRQGDRYEGATATSKRLLRFWKTQKQPRLFFAQIEALETLIWLTEVAPVIAQGKLGVSPSQQATVKSLLDKTKSASREHNDGLDRLAVKMATGTGKTVVMGMVIAWHALNAYNAHKLPEEQRSRYLTSFVAITPGHTVRERLETLKPSPQPGIKSVYEEMNLLPDTDLPALRRVQVRIVNFQRFQPKDRLADASGDAKRLLRAYKHKGSNKGADIEDRSAMLRRVLRGLRGLTGTDPNKQICVLNDEAHHCYLPQEGVRSGEDKDDDKAAALWFSAIKSLDEAGWLGAVYDFSATPMFIQTTNRKESKMFPWTVSDYPLMDAIEAGLVKIPRVPIKDDSPDGDDVKWRNLYKHVDVKSLKGKIPTKLHAALKTLYDDYEKQFHIWQEEKQPTPPVFIVVANNTANADFFYHHLSGTRTVGEDGQSWVDKPSNYELFSNFAQDGIQAASLNTLLVHSKLEGDDAIGKNSALGRAIHAQADLLEERKRQLADEGKDVSEYDKLSEQELIRKALNTVGRPGELGSDIRCVVSVQMLTEGWDTKTVTHVLGYRAFGTQLLCEQVTGRALRRVSYDSLDENGRLEPLFAEVFGIPFDFMPVGGPQPPAKPPRPTYTVRSIPGREEFRIEFPRLTGYLIEPSGVGIKFESENLVPYSLSSGIPTKIIVAGVAGESKEIDTSEGGVRYQSAIVAVAAQVAEKMIQLFKSEVGDSGNAMPRRVQLLRESMPIVEQWLSHPLVDIKPDQVWRLLDGTEADRAASHVVKVCVPDLSNSSKAKRIGVFAEGDFLATTEGVSFDTSQLDHFPLDLTKQTKKSELNIAPCDSGWEVDVARVLDRNSKVRAWVRNSSNLGWRLPYEFEGTWREYEPDFVARLGNGKGGYYGDSTAVHLLVEVKGQPDDRSAAKEDFAKYWWAKALQNSPQTPAHLRRWKFVELPNKDHFAEDLNRAITDALSDQSE